MWSSCCITTRNNMFTPVTEIIRRRMRRGDVQIDHVTLTQDRIFLDNLRAIRNGTPFMQVRPGKYCRLIIRGQLVMSDTQMEQRTNAPFIMCAKGSVLIGGLGIGLVLSPLLKRECVTSITVIEKEQDVISLVAKKYKHKKLSVVCDDVESHEPDQKFDTIYMDIWPDLNTDNLEQMNKLKRRYRKYLNKFGWIGCWSETELRVLKRRGW